MGKSINNHENRQNKLPEDIQNNFTMRFSEISYEENILHPIYGTYLPKTIGVKVILNEGEDEMEAQRKAREFVAKTAAEIYPEPVDSRTQTRLLVPAETDKEFDALRIKLNEFDNREDAQAYLETTDYKWAIEAKNIVNQIKSKHEKAK